jgi:hypothetical protein
MISVKNICKSVFSRKLILGICLTILISFIIYLLLKNNNWIKFNLIDFVLVMFFLTIFILALKVFFYIIVIQDNSKKINAELPFFINNLCNDLDKGINFKKSLENRVLDNSIISKDIKQALILTNGGKYSINETLLIISKNNIVLKDFIIQLLEVISFGAKNRSYSLKILASNVIKKQNLALKDFGTKLNFVTLLYIIFSSILPAMLLIFFIIGSNFFELDFSNLQIIFIIVVLLPLINMVIMFFIKNITP